MRKTFLVVVAIVLFIVFLFLSNCFDGCQGCVPATKKQAVFELGQSVLPQQKKEVAPTAQAPQPASTPTEEQKAEPNQPTQKRRRSALPKKAGKGAKQVCSKPQQKKWAPTPPTNAPAADEISPSPQKNVLSASPVPVGPSQQKAQPEQTPSTTSTRKVRVQYLRRVVEGDTDYTIRVEYKRK